ncbi:hypothetical protein [Aldersonia kunmingensis]|uniref:hypothetical protein n=1 Tax=Aldersonia kunmingensis TaxID=408066 RepID=UPI00082E0F98|nr:hypothetical protein [Aldersonia kunmingensis]
MNLVNSGRSFFDQISKQMPKGGVAILTWVGLTTAAAIALSEVDRLISHAVTPGANSTIGEIVGPGAVGATDSWDDWTDALPESRYPDALGPLIGWHIAFDAIFFIGYGVLLWRAIDAAYDSPVLRRHGGTVAKVFLSILLVAEVVEGVLLLICAFLVDSGVGFAAVLVAIVATVKWAGVLALVVTLVRSRNHRFVVVAARTVRRVWHALWIQRLSGVVVLVLVALTLLPLAGPLDQIPDAARGWFSPGAGLGHLFLATVAYLLAALGLFVVGRRRSERIADKYGDAPVVRGDASLAPWVLLPAAVAVIALWLDLSRRGNLLDPFVAGLFIVVPSTIAATTLIVRWIANPDSRHSRSNIGWAAAVVGLFVVVWWLVRDDPGRNKLLVVPLVLILLTAIVALIMNVRGQLDVTRESLAAANPEFVQRVRTTGDVLALLVLTAAAASSVRAFTAPVVLGFATGRGAQAGLVAVLVVGWALLLVLPYFASRLVRVGSDRFENVVDRHRRGVDIAVLIVSGAALGAFVSYPRLFADWSGVVATAIVAVAAWSVGIGVFIVRLQERRPLEVFRLFAMEAAPVLTLTAALLVAVSMSGGDPDLHRVRTASTDRKEVERKDLPTEFAEWRDRREHCEQVVGGVRVRPLVLVAASGGGIRAAVWTADTMAQISDMGVCGKTAVYASSGVSGGSVGLAVARQLAGPTSKEQSSSVAVREAMSRLSEPDALAEGLAGTLIGDQFAAATGIRAQAEDELSNWRDRAGLMEEAWERQIPELKDGYSWDVAGPTGLLIFNSTAATAKCRVLISQFELGPPGAGQGPNCQDADGEPASAIDFANTLAGCFPDMRWSTAAMLSARFPLVTPSGRIVPTERDPSKACEAASLQLIDGGYSEGEGLATLADIAPALAVLIRDHNAGSPDQFIVPYVIYLNDEPGVDVVATQAKAAPEAIVPLIGKDAKAQLTERDAWIQRITNAFATEAICPTYGVCAKAVEATWPRGRDRKGDEREPHPVLTVAPPAAPAVEVPLGWTLSRASRETLEEAVGPAGEACVANAADPEKTSAGMIELARLLCPRTS